MKTHSYPLGEVLEMEFTHSNLYETGEHRTKAPPIRIVSRQLNYAVCTVHKRFSPTVYVPTCKNVIIIGLFTANAFSLGVLKPNRELFCRLYDFFFGLFIGQFQCDVTRLLWFNPTSKSIWKVFWVVVCRSILRETQGNNVKLIHIMIPVCVYFIFEIKYSSSFHPAISAGLNLLCIDIHTFLFVNVHNILLYGAFGD